MWNAHLQHQVRTGFHRLNCLNRWTWQYLLEYEWIVCECLRKRWKVIGLVGLLALSLGFVERPVVQVGP